MSVEMETRSRFSETSSMDFVTLVCLMLNVRRTKNRGSVQRDYVNKTHMRKSLFSLFKQLCLGMGVHLEMPVINALPVNLSGLRCGDWIHDEHERWAQELLEQMTSDTVGRVVVHDNNSLSYSFFEVDRRRGIMNNSLTRTITKHDILKPRYRRLPAKEVEMPDKARKMIDLIMKEDHSIRKYFTVITGTLAAKESKVTKEWKEDTALKKAIFSTQAKIIAGATALAGLVGAGATAVASMDPALVFANVVFYGWE